ncbi:MAG TPA: 30S ribosomal protein S9 [Thermogutta sp.]|nr:30S ribosomal protein S9 [Thermogutta sp.]
MAKVVKKLLVPGKGTNDVVAVGRRKATAVARARVRPGTGIIAVNGRPMEEYFPNLLYQNVVLQPLIMSGRRESVDVVVRVAGGGISGQADAVKLAIARALVKMDPELHKPFKDAGLLTADARKKERKKYGLHGARRGTQFSKR